VLDLNMMTANVAKSLAQGAYEAASKAEALRAEIPKAQAEGMSPAAIRSYYEGPAEKAEAESAQLMRHHQVASNGYLLCATDSLTNKYQTMFADAYTEAARQRRLLVSDEGFEVGYSR
jgi:hypothetical protein